MNVLGSALLLVEAANSSPSPSPHQTAILSCDAVVGVEAQNIRKETMNELSGTFLGIDPWLETISFGESPTL